MRLRDLGSSPALRVTLVFGLSGAAFAAGNILLARALPASEYGLVALVVALIQISVPLGPAGVDGVVNRRKLDPGPRLLRRILLTSSLVGVGTIVAARFLYGVQVPLLLIILLATLAGGANVVAGARYQSLSRFRASMALTQGPNYSVAIAGILTGVLGISHAWFPCLILALGFTAPAIVGWTRILSGKRSADGPGDDFAWSEGIAVVGVSVAGIALIQLERLVIPQVLTLGDLATYSVLAAIAGAPFRMLQMGVGYTMLPRLRAATTVSERRHLVAREGAVAMAVVVAASLALWVLTPIIVRAFLSGRYTLPGTLIFAALVTGSLKVFSAFASSANVALGSTRQLAYLNASAWISVALATVASVLGSRWGLVGAVYGVGVGWLTHAIAGACLAAPHLADSARPISERPPLDSEDP